MHNLADLREGVKQTVISGTSIPGLEPLHSAWYNYTIYVHTSPLLLNTASSKEEVPFWHWLQVLYQKGKVQLIFILCRFQELRPGDLLGPALALCRGRATRVMWDTWYYSWCSFSMMVKWANYGILQANDGEMLLNDGEMLLDDGEMSEWSYTQSPSLTSISPSLTSIIPSLTSIFPSLALSKPSFAHLTIIEKLHRLY